MIAVLRVQLCVRIQISSRTNLPTLLRVLSTALCGHKFSRFEISEAE